MNPLDGDILKVDVDAPGYDLDAIMDAYSVQALADYRAYVGNMPPVEAVLSAVFGVENMVMINCLLEFDNPDIIADAIHALALEGRLPSFVKNASVLQAVGIINADAASGMLVPGPLYYQSLPYVKSYFQQLGLEGKEFVKAHDYEGLVRYLTGG